MKFTPQTDYNVTVQVHRIKALQRQHTISDSTSGEGQNKYRNVCLAPFNCNKVFFLC